MATLLVVAVVSACEETTYEEVEESSVQESTISITDAPPRDEINGKTLDLPIQIAPGLYGPATVQSWETYTYSLVVPSNFLAQYPNGTYYVYIQEDCPPSSQWTWCNVVSQQVGGNTIYVTFPDEGPNKEWRLVYHYIAPGYVDWYTGTKVVTAD